MPALTLSTLGLVTELASGDVIVTLAAEPDLASFGDEEDALLEAQMFLAEHLARAEPEVVARFALPEGARLHATDVVVPRSDLVRRWNVSTPVRFSSLVIPTLPNAKGVRDAWIVILALRHTFFARAAEDIDAAIASEVKRLAAARQLSPLAWLDLLPAQTERVRRLEVAFSRGGAAEVRRGADLKKRVSDREAREQAAQILESVAEPMGGAPGEPRPFPLRDRELALLGAALGGEERASTLLVGKERVGKSGLFRAWLEREHAAHRPRFVYATSGARLVAGMSGFGQWQERVQRVMQAAHRLDAILYFDDLGDLFHDRAGGHVDVPSAMRPFLEDGRVRVVGEIREEVLERVEAHNGAFFSCFGRVRVEPLDARGAATVLEVLAADEALREPDRPGLDAAARAALIELSERYLPYESFPGKVVRLSSEIRAAKELALGSEAAGAVIGADDVREAFSVRTGVPMFLLRDEAALRVDDVFAQLRTRLVGQDEAVRRVAELVGVVKAGLQPAGKPLATLLFVGPTGVGKTELARALATLLFGSDDRLVRFDMSEYATAYATERLFRGADGGEGLLTRKVREQPFSVVLLDEIEKAHPGAFDLLLQVCGEGRLTDGRGKTAFFHNAIVILTSNLGAAHRRPQTGFAHEGARGGDAEAHYARVVRETFRPELVNRLDRVVVFRALELEDIREVTRIATARAARRRGVVERGIDVSISDGALARLAEGGLSEAYGARALRRHVERALVTPLGRLISNRAGADGERVVVSVEDEPTAPGEERGEVQGGLRLGVVRTSARRGTGDAHTLGRITGIRREAHRQLRLDRVVELRDHVGYLVVELSLADARRRRGDPAPDGQQVAMRTGEHARLAEICDRLERSFAAISAVEELALVAFVAGDPFDGMHGEAVAERARFRGALVHALVAQEQRRNTATVLLTELDDRRALDVWLAPLLDEAVRREWRIEGHVDGDREAPDEGLWPARRRFGPPRSPSVLAERLAAKDRTFRNVVLRVAGDHAAVWLGLEAGLHRFTGFTAATEPAHLHVSLIALRTNLGEDDWKPPVLDPPNAEIAAGLARGHPLRTRVRGKDLVVLLDGEATVELPEDAYWPRFEEIALEHLLLFERLRALDRDDQLRPRIDDSLAEVRAILRQGNKIMAIKRYREIVGCGLKEAKDAVEAMG